MPGGDWGLLDIQQVSVSAYAALRSPALSVLCRMARGMHTLRVARQDAVGKVCFTVHASLTVRSCPIDSLTGHSKPVGQVSGGPSSRGTAAHGSVLPILPGSKENERHEAHSGPPTPKQKCGQKSLLPASMYAEGHFQYITEGFVFPCVNQTEVYDSVTHWLFEPFPNVWKQLYMRVGMRNDLLVLALSRTQFHW